MTDNSIRFEKVDYDSLNAKQKEIYNFQRLAGRLAGYGFNCIKLADDWQGADFLAFHKDGKTTLRVQLKSRLTIDDKKYRGKNIWIAFPHRRQKKEDWYLVKHEHLVKKVGGHTRWLKSLSWTKYNRYSSTSINTKLLGDLAGNRLEP